MKLHEIILINIGLYKFMSNNQKPMSRATVVCNKKIDTRNTPENGIFLKKISENCRKLKLTNGIKFKITLSKYQSPQGHYK